MNTYIINGAEMTSRESAWAEIRRVFDTPEWFGNNLDALNDILTGVNGEIRFTHACRMLNSLEGYGCRMLQVFYDAARNNPHISFIAGGHE